MASLELSEFKTVIRTFQSVFPDATLWYMNHSHTNFALLVGCRGQWSLDAKRIEDRMLKPQVRSSLAAAGLLDPLQIAHCMHLDAVGLKMFAGEGPLHTDEEPVLLKNSALGFYRSRSNFLKNLEAIAEVHLRHYTSVIKNLPADIGPVFENYRLASEQFIKVLLEYYRFDEAVQKGDRQLGLKHLENALKEAHLGHAAFPVDKVREYFYQGVRQTHDSLREELGLPPLEATER